MKERVERRRRKRVWRFARPEKTPLFKTESPLEEISLKWGMKKNNDNYETQSTSPKQ